MFTKQRQDGFSLIEVSIILIIAGLMLSTFFQMKQIVSGEENRIEFYSAVDILGDSLEQYALINGFYPTPASYTLAAGDNDFGKPISDYTTLPDFSASQCNAGAAMVNGIFCRPGQRDIDSIGGIGNIEDETVLIGALPTSILGLNNEEAADMFRQRFTYAVSRNLTNPATFNDEAGIIRVLSHQTMGDALSTSRDVHYVVVSHGENQSGSYGLVNAAIGTGCGNVIVDPLERENCDVDSVFLVNTNSSLARDGSPSIINDHKAEHILDAGGDYFDDAVSFTRTVRGSLWTARGSNEVNMTSGGSGGNGRVIIGDTTYSHWEMNNSWEDFERPQLWVNGSARAEQVIATRLCDRGQDNCFKINDIVSPDLVINDEVTGVNKTTKCNFSALKDVNMINHVTWRKHGRTGEAKGDCEDIMRLPATNIGTLGGVNTICANGARGVRSDGTLRCY